MRNKLRKEEERILRNILFRAREILSRIHKKPPSRIFNESNLRSIMKNLPTTEKELLECWGIGKKKCEQFGPFLLIDIKIFLVMVCGDGNGTEINSKDGDESERDVIVEKLMSIEDVVNEKFERAKKNNEIIIL